MIFFFLKGSGKHFESLPEQQGLMAVSSFIQNIPITQTHMEFKIKQIKVQFYREI